MMTKRTSNQIRTLVTAFQEVNNKFGQGKAVDRELSAWFRRNRQVGSKDRRYISGSIFGYYRWYGWLNRLESERLIEGLMLGYLLDGNGVDERVRYGLATMANVEGELLDPDLFQQAATLQEKIRLFSRQVFPVSPLELVPDLAGSWDIARIEAVQTRPPVWVRLAESDTGSFLKFLEANRISYRIHERDAHALEVLSPFNIQESADYRKGRVEIQDISSQAVGLVCNPEPGSTWWDACAGSGGKALHLSALMLGRGTVFATEVNDLMFLELKRRTGRSIILNNINVQRWDGGRIPDFPQPLDGILVDAPCSCSGTWRRNPELRWRISKEQVAEYARTQLNLLEVCHSGLQVGGYLVYATCSLFSEENEEVIEQFLSLHPEFSQVRIENPLTGQSSDFGLTVEPPESNGNGMFVAKLQRQG